LQLHVQILKRISAEGPRGPLARVPVESMLDTVERDSARLLKTIDNLLDVARLATGRLVVDTESVELAEVVQDALEQLRPELERAGSIVTLHAAGRPRGRWDRLRIEQVATNILANAAKYGEGRPI